MNHQTYKRDSPRLDVRGKSAPAVYNQTFFHYRGVTSSSMLDMQHAIRFEGLSRSAQILRGLEHLSVPNESWMCLASRIWTCSCTGLPPLRFWSHQPSQKWDTNRYLTWGWPKSTTLPLGTHTLLNTLPSTLSGGKLVSISKGIISVLKVVLLDISNQNVNLHCRFDIYTIFHNSLYAF